MQLTWCDPLQSWSLDDDLEILGDIQENVGGGCNFDLTRVVNEL